MPLAQADVVVPRNQLESSLARRSIRLQLYEAVGKLGTVRSVIRYVRDPIDGPHGHPSDDLAIVRIVADVEKTT